MRKGILTSLRTINRRNEIYNAVKANFQHPPLPVKDSTK